MKKRLICLGLCLMMAICCLPKIEAKADLGGWTTDGNGVMTITGTSVTVKINGNKAIIGGIGEIPDYEPATYTKRPWHYFDIDTVEIGAGITRVGAYAFADKTTLKNIIISSTTFVADGTTFSNISNAPIIRLKGINSSMKLLGNIAYPSLDSIVANAPGGRSCAFITDGPAAISMLNSMTYPYLPYVYSAGDTEGPWNTRKDMTKDVKFTKLGSVLTGDTNAILQVYKKPQGELYMNVISHFLKDYTYCCSYNIAMTTTSGTQVYGTNGNRRYSVRLDGKDQIWSRKYCMIEILPDGQILYLPDIDQDYATVTFETYYPSGTYALVYKYE